MTKGVVIMEEKRRGDSGRNRGRMVDEEGYYREEESPKRKRRGRRALVVALISMLTLILAIGAFVYGLLNSMRKGAVGIDPSGGSAVSTPGYDDDDIVVESPDNVLIGQQNAIDKNVYNFILLGMDSDSSADGTRTDTMMVVSFNKKTNKIMLISMLRDMWVKIPGHGSNRLNTASMFGGVGLTINLINQNFGLDLQNYALVGYDEFQSIIDDLGGIELELTKDEVKYINTYAHSSKKLKAGDGTYTLNGEQAMHHCRNRSVGNSDFSRTSRQRTVVTAVFDQLKQQDVATITKLIKKATSIVETNMSPADIVSLGVEVLTARNITIEQMSIPADGTWDNATKNGRSVLVVDFKKNEEIIHDKLFEY